MSFAIGGAFPPTLIPAGKKQALATNYLSFNGSSNNTGDSDTFAQQYLPELYEAEIERYGNRTLQGFLRMVGAEMPMSSDQVIWTEQNRLHIAYDGCTIAANNTDITVPLEAGKQCMIRVGATIVISEGLVTLKGKVTAVAAAVAGPPRTATVTVATYKVADMSSLAGAAGGAKVFVYGSEFGKGTDGMDVGNRGVGADVTTITPDFTQFSNKPIIIKDYYEVSGSDTAQIGWVEVATEAGQSGFLWYLKAESETRLRYEDYLEMAMVEAEKKGANGAAQLATDKTEGSEGLFAAIEDRGNVYNDFAGAAAPGAGALGDFDTILKQLDTQGAIEENMLFLSRQTALDFDDMIAAMNGAYASTGSVSYGLFNNEEDMALNFGFSGFRRGSYDFYKTDWKYLNDFSTRGNIGDIDGVLIPAGTSTVYDQLLGSNIRRPFLHVRYRASEADDRRMKSWVVGSVGAATTGLDAMQIHFLSERLLCVQGANNFVLFKSTV